MTLHSFAICAYKDSPYLEACIRSLKAQTITSDILLCTSTPSPYIEKICEKYNIPMFVRHGESNIRDDWNFAYHKANSRFVTIAHQDDCYHKDYGRTLMEAAQTYSDMTLFTSGYTVVKNDRLSRFEPVEFIKRILRLPLRFKSLSHLPFIKRGALIFGNSICCPVCAYNKEMLGEPLFTSSYKFALDWDTLYQLSDVPGRFICVEKPLLYYRVHQEATTRACIKDRSRSREEAEMFRKMWPKPIVKVLMYFYKMAYKEYQ